VKGRNNPAELAQLLRDLIDSELPKLRAVTEERAAVPRGENGWCPKQELGHLIDSATNNHLRFMTAATAGEYRGPAYAQQDWVRLHGYREMPWEEVVTFWFQYNRLLARLVGAIPEASLDAPCTVGAYPVMTLAELIEDYASHARHHINQLLGR
jgi:hypothetical protein